MQPLILAAGIITLALWLIHTISGGRQIATPMMDAAFDDVAKHTMFVCWHVVTLQLLGGGIALVVIGLRAPSIGGELLTQAISTLHLGFAALFIGVAARSRIEGRFIKLGQWIAFLPLGLMGWAATL